MVAEQAVAWLLNWMVGQPALQTAPKRMEQQTLSRLVREASLRRVAYFQWELDLTVTALTAQDVASTMLAEVALESGVWILAAA